MYERNTINSVLTETSRTSIMEKCIYKRFPEWYDKMMMKKETCILNTMDEGLYSSLDKL